MASVELHPARSTLHAHFNRDMAPCAEIDSGDTVVVRTLDVGWGMEPPTSTTAPRRKFEPRDPRTDDGPCMIGPVWVRGAEPGHVLEVRIESLAPGPWGWTYAGAGVTPPALADAVGMADAPLALVRWEIDRVRRVARNQFGHVVALHPFLGIVGVAPGESGVHSGWHPRRTGGNMDCWELIEGSTVLLPVCAPGALLSLGDGHAAQGDGEVGGTAIECCMEPATVRVSVRRDMRIDAPRIRTGDGWVMLGFGATMEEAAHGALRGVVDHLCAAEGVSRAEALALAGVCADLRITQVVNGVVGVHAIVRDDALRASG